MDIIKPNLFIHLKNIFQDLWNKNLILKATLKK